MKKKTNHEEMLQDFLALLDANLAQQMLEDLNDPMKRCPTLYNAINKMLDRHKFQVTSIAPDEEKMNKIANTLKLYHTSVKGNGLEDDDLYLN